MARGSRCRILSRDHGWPSTAKFITFAHCAPNSKLWEAKFATSGDSEVLLKALVQWGERALQKLEGMFAFAFWDARQKSFWLAIARA